MTRYISEGGAGGTAANVEWTPDVNAVAAALDLDAEAWVFTGPNVVGAVTLTDISQVLTGPTCQGDFVELRWDATWTIGANSAVNDGPDNWTNPGNTTGLRDAVEASRAGQALAATDANLHLTYANSPGALNPSFTITSVALRYDTRQTGTVLNNGGLWHEYRLAAAGGWTTLEIFTADVDNNPKSYDITAAVGGSWALIDALEVRVRAVLPIGSAPVTDFCDAVEVQVISNLVVAV